MPRLAGRTLTEKLALNSVQASGCLRWTGAHTRTGYGQIRTGGKSVAVHRLAYELAIGPIPEDLEIDHLCSVRDCILPEHLEPVTHHENLARRFRKIRADGFCTAGHEVTGDNAKRRPDGRVRCRQCFNAARRKKKGAEKSHE